MRGKSKERKRKRWIVYLEVVLEDPGVRYILDPNAVQSQLPRVVEDLKKTKLIYEWI